MEQYIPKSALVAEIEKEIKHIYAGREYVGIPLDEENRVYGLQIAKGIIDTLEVKEVDLEHEVESYWKQCDMTWCRDAYSMTHIRSMLSDIAKHFFELGIKARKEEVK